MLAELMAKTFYDTFAKDNTAEDMRVHLETSYSPEIQLAELSSPDHVFLIAEAEGMPVGFAQLILGSVEESIHGSKPAEVRRIYVTKEYIGKGVGKELIQAAIGESKGRGCECLWLGVWEKNPHAIEFYKKWGFREVGSHVFMVGNDPQTDYIMELHLS
jgi:GNAT superfamily N-acetyltransferase